METYRRFPLHYITEKNPTWDRVNDLNWFVSDFKIISALVKVADLVGTQAYVTIAGLKDLSERPIFVVKIRGVLYIRDGHHRVTAALLTEQKTITAEVLELEETNV